MDQSWPHQRPGEKVDLHGDTPISVNSSIDVSLFPSQMIDTRDVLHRLLQCSPEDLIVKIDWADAYKHCPVRIEDLPLNAVTIGEKVFVELSCTFGCSSSVGIFDNLAEICLRVVCQECVIKRLHVLRMLDDNVLVASAIECFTFYHQFLNLANDVNIRLAGFSHGKAFAPQHRGQILGLTYDLPSWQVSLDEEKLLPILILLWSMVDEEMVKNEDLETLNGKLTHYAILAGEKRIPNTP